MNTKKILSLKEINECSKNCVKVDKSKRLELEDEKSTFTFLGLF